MWQVCASGGFGFVGGAQRRRETARRTCSSFTGPTPRIWPSASRVRRAAAPPSRRACDRGRRRTPAPAPRVEIVRRRSRRRAEQRFVGAGRAPAPRRALRCRRRPRSSTARFRRGPGPRSRRRCALLDVDARAEAVVAAAARRARRGIAEVAQHEAAAAALGVRVLLHRVELLRDRPCGAGRSSPSRSRNAVERLASAP